MRKSRLSEYLVVAQVLKPQGIKGELKLKAITDSPERFYDLRDVYFLKDNKYEKRRFSLVRIQDEFIYARIDGIKDRNTAETYRDEYVYIKREDAVELPDGRWFIVDLIGCDVIDEAGEEVGELTSIIQTGANDVYVIDCDKNQWMLPIMEDSLIEVNIEEGIIRIKRERLCEVDPGAY